VNILFFIAMTATCFSGFMISRSIFSTLGIQFSTGRGWESIHKLTADASLILLGIHLALHWKWVIVNIGQYILAPIRNLFHRSSTQSSTLAVEPVCTNEDR